MKEFFGFGGYQRAAEGAYSWQHLTFVTFLMIVMIALAVVFGLKNRNKTEKGKNKALITAAILIDTLEIFKIIIMCARTEESVVGSLLQELPLFLCSIQLITLPLAAFSRGRLREAALDFVCIFGVLGAVLGTYAAAQNYGCYPVLSFDNVISGITHCISGFASLYIMITGMTNMKRRNIPFTFSILLGFCVAAYVVNRLIDYNYMFLMRGDGTPYDIVYNLVGGHPVWYPIAVVALFLVYICAFYGVFFFFKNRKSKKG